MCVPLKIQSSPKCKAREIFHRAAYGLYASKKFLRNAVVAIHESPVQDEIWILGGHHV